MVLPRSPDLRGQLLRLDADSADGDCEHERDEWNSDASDREECESARDEDGRGEERRRSAESQDGADGDRGGETSRDGRQVANLLAAHEGLRRRGVDGHARVGSETPGDGSQDAVAEAEGGGADEDDAVAEHASVILSRGDGEGPPADCAGRA